jgi:hypothetical protein
METKEIRYNAALRKIGTHAIVCVYFHFGAKKSSNQAGRITFVNGKTSSPL